MPCGRRSASSRKTTTKQRKTASLTSGRGKAITSRQAANLLRAGGLTKTARLKLKQKASKKK